MEDFIDEAQYCSGLFGSTVLLYFWTKSCTDFTLVKMMLPLEAKSASSKLQSLRMRTFR